MFFQQHPNPFISVIDYNIEVPYKLTHILVLYGLKGNFYWLIKYGKALSIEYSLRYKRTHKSEKVIDWCDNTKDLLIFQLADIQAFTRALPDQYKCSNPIESCREYYLKEKIRFAKWEKGREHQIGC